MKGSGIWVAWSLWVLCFSGAAVADEEGFVSLFNGKDLSGWRIEKGAPFSVRDGVIFLDGGRGSLLSEGKYRDFELRLEFRFVKGGGDSGVFVRVEGKDKYQVQTNSAFGPRGMGSIRGGKSDELKATYDEKAIPKVRKKTGEWYSYVITVKGKHATVAVNGVVLSTAEGLAEREGSIGFQAEGAPLEFRNIRIKKLGVSP